MATYILAIITIIFYCCAVIIQLKRIREKLAARHTLSFAAGWAAVGLHALLLYHWIDVGTGQNLSFLNMLSLVSWLVSGLVLLAAWRKPVENLCLLIFPFASLSILLVIFFPGRYVLNTSANPQQLLHILFSTLAFSVLCVAALQAILLAIQDWQLRHKYATGFIELLPSLETMEALLFQVIALGFILLSIVLITSILFFRATSLSLFLQKTIISCCAWLIFAALLLGRYYFGWRGQTAIRWTLCGVSLLMLIYFGSKLLLN